MSSSQDTRRIEPGRLRTIRSRGEMPSAGLWANTSDTWSLAAALCGRACRGVPSPAPCASP